MQTIWTTAIVDGRVIPVEVLDRATTETNETLALRPQRGPGVRKARIRLALPAAS